MQNSTARLRRNLRKVERDVKHRILGRPWLEVEPYDRFLFSYPRSGNTWLRHIVHHLIQRTDLKDFSELESAVPTIDVLGFNDRRAKLPSGLRFYKSHLPYADYFMDGKVIYVVRDGRDVAMSYYDFQRHIKGYKGTFDEFLHKSFKGWMRYGSWVSNAGSWVAHRNHPHMLLIRYEDMLADQLAIARKVSDFSGLTATDEDLVAAIKSSSVDKVHLTMRTWNAARGTDFVGGISGKRKSGWREQFTPTQNRFFIDMAGDLLQDLGYPLD